MQCTQIKSDGKRCKAMCIRGDDRCLFHSEKKDILLIRKKRKILSSQEMIFELQNLARRIKRTVEDPLKKSVEIRMIYQMIQELKGEGKPETKEEKEGFKRKIEQWKESRQ